MEDKGARLPELVSFLRTKTVQAYLASTRKVQEQLLRHADDLAELQSCSNVSRSSQTFRALIDDGTIQLR